MYPPTCKLDRLGLLFCTHQWHQDGHLTGLLCYKVQPVFADCLMLLKAQETATVPALSARQVVLLIQGAV